MAEDARFSTVPVNESVDSPLDMAAGLMALDHLLMQRTERPHEDPEIRAQLDALSEGKEGVPLARLVDPGPEGWDLQALQRVVQSAYSAFAAHTRPGPGEDGWTVGLEDEERRWVLLEKHGQGGTYMFRFEGLVHAPAGRIAHVNRELDFRTRCLWDHADLKPLHLRLGPRPEDVMVLPAVRRRGPRLIRPYRDKRRQARMMRSKKAPMARSLEIVETYVHPPSVGGVPVPGVATRRLLGVQWGDYDAQKREYILLMPTIEDVPKDERLFGCPSGCVDATGLTGMRLMVDRGNTRHTYVTMLVAVNPNGSIPEQVVSWGRTKLVDRVRLIERVCSDAVFNDIYPAARK